MKNLFKIVKYEFHVLYFVDSLSSQVLLKLDHVGDLILQVDIKLLSNSSLTITLQSRDNKESFFLHYISSDVHISAEVCKVFWSILTMHNSKEFKKILQFSIILLFVSRPLWLSLAI